MTTEEFIEKAKSVYGDKYDYSNTEYKNARSKVCIMCLEHGKFCLRPNIHLNGRGCPECDKDVKNIEDESTLIKEVKQEDLSNKSFVEKASIIHNNKYNYSLVKYKKDTTKVCIICPIHGKFWQKPVHHLKDGCPRCNS